MEQSGLSTASSSRYAQQGAPIVADEVIYAPKKSPRRHKSKSPLRQRLEEQDVATSTQYTVASPRSTLDVQSSQESLQQTRAMIVRNVHMELAQPQPISGQELALREADYREREHNFSLRAEAYTEKALTEAEAKLQRALAKSETKERAEKADAAYREAMIEKKYESRLQDLQAKMQSKLAQAREARIYAEIRASEKAKEKRVAAEENYRWAVANARDTAEMIKTGRIVPEEPSTLTKLAAKMHL